jgi:hypothetical protein
MQMFMSSSLHFATLRCDQPQSESRMLIFGLTRYTLYFLPMHNLCARVGLLTELCSYKIKDGDTLIAFDEYSKGKHVSVDNTYCPFRKYRMTQTDLRHPGTLSSGFRVSHDRSVN